MKDSLYEENFKLHSENARLRKNWSSISRLSFMIMIRLIITMAPVIRNVWLMFSATFRTVSIMNPICHGIPR